MADDDPDLYGIYKNYNTDNSRESAIAYDYNDDEVWKMFYIGNKEKVQAHYAFIWIYGKSFGVPSETSQGYSHQLVLYNDWYPAGITLGSFYSFEKFDSDVFQWQRFVISKYYFRSTGWNRIEIKDCDINTPEYGGWQINNLRIGIDETFEYIDDFDHSFWYSGGAGVTPDNPRDINGELMIALELVDVRHDDHAFPSLQWNWDNNYHLGLKDRVPIDDSNDEAKWRVWLTSNDFAYSSYARLYFYGWAWSSAPQSETVLNIRVNDLLPYDYHPMNDFGACGPIGAWSWIEIDLDVLTLGWNEFYFYDTTTHTNTNFALIRFTNVNSDQSCWKYNDGTGDYGTLDYNSDFGELGVYLVMFDDVKKREMDRTIYTIELSRDDVLDTEPYKHFQYPEYNFDEQANWLGQCLDWNQDWINYESVQQDWNNPGAYQGYIYDENIYGRGDAVDFEIVSGHGTFDEFALQLYQEPGQDSRDFSDTYSFTAINHQPWMEDYTEAEFFDYPISDYTTQGEDGFNYNTEWLVFIACNIFAKVGSGSNEFDVSSAYRTLLYHSLHTVMSYCEDFSLSDGEMYYFVDDFYDYLTSGGSFTVSNVIDAFIAVSQLYDQPWGYFTHENNRWDYLWDEGYVSRDRDSLIDMKFENKDDIKCDWYDSG